MPWSQMIIMNIRPPRATAARKLDSTPAVKARMRNRASRNIGSALVRSMTPNAPRKAAPMASSLSTVGLVQPIVWPP